VSSSSDLLPPDRALVPAGAPDGPAADRRGDLPPERVALPPRPPIQEASPRQFGRVQFAHPAEEEFARLLDFYRVAWEYEPTSFPLRWENGRVTEMFTPDIYLPEHELYVELTTMKQSLITRKHRKLRRMREMYPDVRVVLLTRNDYYDLLARIGYGAVAIDALPESDIDRILYSPAEIASRVASLGAEISNDYAGRTLILVGLLKGVTFFMADLARAITRPLAIDFLSVAPPSRDTGQDGVRFVKDLDTDICGQHVLLIEDIATTGFTLDFVLNRLRERNPASLEVCLLFDKRERRLVDVPIRYTGFTIPNAFVVGYGLDDRERYRNLPFLCILKPNVYSRDLSWRVAEHNNQP
jgi:hypoxanthine phosphoribosyltransferase